MLFLTISSILLMVLDYQHQLVFLRRALADVVAPIQYSVSYSAQFVKTLNVHWVDRQRLLTENQALKEQVLFLQAELQKFIALVDENKQLRSLLTSSSLVTRERMSAAQVLFIENDLLISEIVIDKGKHDGVYPGQPVLDAHGIVGQVIQVGWLTSRVLLLTDSRSSIPVRNMRSGIRGIVVGQGKLAPLVLTHVLGPSDVKAHDSLVSSGIGGAYPRGYPVGVVDSVQFDASKQSVVISVRPSAQLERDQTVLLIWPEKKQ